MMNGLSIIFTNALELGLLHVALEEFSSDTFCNKSGDFAFIIVKWAFSSFSIWNFLSCMFSLR